MSGASGRARVEFESVAARRRLVAAMRGWRPMAARGPVAAAAIFVFLAIALHGGWWRGSFPHRSAASPKDSPREPGPLNASREVDDMRARTMIGFAAMALAASPAFGADRLVPEQYPTIQSAVDASAAGDVVSVASGVYTESIDLRGKAITLSARSALGASIRAPGNVRAILMTSGETASTRVTGFRFIGSKGYGGGILVSGSSPVIDHCAFVGVRNASGGGALVLGGSARFDFCHFDGCIADMPMSGFGSGGAMRKVGGGLVVADCTFENNAGPTNAAGIMNESGGISILRCDFGAHDPVASIIYNGDSGQMTIADCVFHDDNSPQQRGAICFSWGSREIRRCVFRNISLAGAAILASGGHTVVQECTFERINSTGNAASGISNLAWATFAVGGSSFCGMTPAAIGVAYRDLGGNSFASTCVPPCLADIVRDAMVNGADLATILVYWGTNGSQFPGVDIDGNGVVNGSDLAAVLAAWGPCPH